MNQRFVGSFVELNLRWYGTKIMGELLMRLNETVVDVVVAVVVVVVTLFQVHGNVRTNPTAKVHP